MSPLSGIRPVHVIVQANLQVVVATESISQFFEMNQPCFLAKFWLFNFPNIRSVRFEALSLLSPSEQMIEIDVNLNYFFIV